MSLGTAATPAELNKPGLALLVARYFAPLVSGPC
jgi:hypothetical protein